MSTFNRVDLSSKMVFNQAEFNLNSLNLLE